MLYRICRSVGRIPPILVLAPSIGVVSAGCGEPDPALEVGGISFSDNELLGLDPDRRRELTAITALGLAFARDEIDSVGEPLVERWIEDRVLERFRSWLVLDRAAVGEEALRAQYRTDPRFELVVRHVVALAEEGQAEDVHEGARATAEQALARVEAGDDFAEVAADLSEEPGAAERGGLLQPGREGSWVDGFWQAASGLEVGEHTGVVQTEYGYHVIRLEERNIVPFQEVRGAVVRDAGTMLGGLDEAWTAWADSVAEEIRVDTVAVRQWLSGASAGEATLARWPGGSYSSEIFSRHATSLEADRWSEILGPERSEAAVLSEVGRESLRHRALIEARDLDLALGSAASEEVARRWRDQAVAWAVQLGFTADALPARVKELAMEALGSSGQNATIVRQELRARMPLLLAAYPVDETQDP